MRLKLISSFATTLIWILICFCCCCVFLLSLSHCSTPFLCFYIFVLWVRMNYQLIYLYFIQIEVLSSADCGADSNSGREDSSTSTSLEFWSDFHNKLYLNSKLAVSSYFFTVHGALVKQKVFHFDSFWQVKTKLHWSKWLFLSAAEILQLVLPDTVSPRFCCYHPPRFLMFTFLTFSV